MSGGSVLINMSIMGFNFELKKVLGKILKYHKKIGKSDWGLEVRQGEVQLQ